MKDNASGLQVARKAAKAAASVIAGRFGQAHDVQIKQASGTLVTDTDKAAETAILNVLRQESPWGILSEESGVSGQTDGPLWVVDPLDGTSNFARSLPLFAVSIALVEGKDVYLGVIADPMHGMEYYAEKGKGAFCNGQQMKTASPLHTVPVLFLNHGSNAEDAGKCAKLTTLLAGDYRIRKLGTTALELCYVATGSFDGFICSGDELWDFAAGALIASEAGCRFTDWKGNGWDGAGNHILVSRPAIHQQLVAVASRLQ